MSIAFVVQRYVDGIDLVLKLAVGMPLLAFYHPLLLGFAIVLVVLLLTRELLVTSFRGLSESRGQQFGAQFSGKVGVDGDAVKSVSFEVKIATLVADAAGVVTAVDAEVGQVLAAGTPVVVGQEVGRP